MREDFLHYLWKYKKFDTSDLYTTASESVIILNGGDYTQKSGPDFFNAQLIIGEQKWAGNVEIHLKSSDWYLHHHEVDAAYENVILHVVWEHDSDIFRSDNSEIPVIELRNFTSKRIVENYTNLTAVKSWIFCEKQIADVDNFMLSNWLERLFFERLKKKSDFTMQLYLAAASNWETVLFYMLAKNFGLNTNAESMLDIAMQIPLRVLKRESHNVQNLESLLFGYANLLHVAKEDTYFKQLCDNFTMLRQKYQLPEPNKSINLEFFKLRPVNFPTIRLAQLAMLYSKNEQLFSKIMTAVTMAEYYQLFKVEVSQYWKSHFQFDRECNMTSKALSKSFIDLLVINTVVPLRFAYALQRGEDITDLLLNLVQEIKPESNAIIAKFATVNVDAKNAVESQALLQLKKEYCIRGKCLDCAIGVALLKQTNAIV